MPFTPTNSIFYYGLLAGCLLLGLALTVLAWRRPNQRQRGFRVLASIAASLALWLLAFPPMRQVPTVRARAILLTDGYAPDTLQKLLRRLGTGTAVWYYGSATPPAKARRLPSLLTLAEQQPTLRRLELLGRGLPAAELPLLGKMQVQWHAGEMFNGIRTALWPQKLTLGDMLRVEGSVVPDAKKAPAWVCLRAAGTIRDSVQLPAGGGAFQLHYRPKTAGLVVYEVLLRRSGQPLVSEPVPVEITTPQLPAVLLLAASPSFEFKFLKSYLAEAHYPVALRTAVSRGLVQTDAVNQPAATLDRLTPTVLARYSVVVADAATMAGSSGAEAQALQAAVKAGRLGLLVLADAAPLPRATPARADFVVLPRAAAQAVSQSLTWPDAPAEARAALPAHLQMGAALRPLVTGPGAALVAARRRFGLGFVVVSVVPETFQWGLQGHLPVYTSFWNRLLTAVVPPATLAASWHVGARWPRLHEPLTLHLTAPLPAANPTVSALKGGPVMHLALRQDTRLPEWSTAQFWPTLAGWHQVKGPGSTMHSFYVYDAAAWQGPEGEQRQLALAQRPAPTTTVAVSAVTVAEPWPASWFLVLFLLAAGYLWLEEKL